MIDDFISFYCFSIGCYWALLSALNLLFRLLDTGKHCTWLFRKASNFGCNANVPTLDLDAADVSSFCILRSYTTDTTRLRLSFVSQNQSRVMETDLCNRG